MKVLLLNGSPHADGCTAAALREVASTLECEGVETEILHVVGQPIRGCTACRRCKENPGRCVFDDDLVNRVLEKMEHDVNISVKEGVATESDALAIKVKANEANMMKTKATHGLVLA